MHNITAEQVQAEFAKGRAFKDSLGLYEQVKKNEKFYLGEQWDGLKVSKIQPVTLNILRRVTSLFQAQVVSDDISWEIRPFLRSEQSEFEGRALDEAVRMVFEKQAIRTKNRKALRSGVVDGDMCLYFWFDPSIETGQPVKGDIRCEPLANVNVYFGDPHTQEVQGQPYIIVARRRPLATVRKEAKANGVADWKNIQSDAGAGDESEYAQVTELTRFWKVRRELTDESGIVTGSEARVHVMTVCGEVVTRPETETGMTLYPLAWSSWIERPRCMHGVSPITEAIPTQIAINKQATYIVAYAQNLAMPKLVYNANRLPNGWNGDPGKAIGVAGDPREVIANPIGGVQMPSGVFSSLETLQSMMKDCMGASDAALGNIANPDNTSAILATQKASNAPLELQKRAFEQFNEDCVRIIVDMACAYYGQRVITVSHKETGMDGSEREVTGEVLIDFDALRTGALDINVEVGAASYWSEIVAMTNMDKLQQAGLIADPLLYLESIPNSYIPNKQALIEAMRRRQEGGERSPSVTA